MKKKTISLWSLGVIATIATPVMVNIYGKRQEESDKSVIPVTSLIPIKKVFTAQEEINEMLDLLAPVTNDNTFKNPDVKNKVSNIIVKFLKDGLNGINIGDIDYLLTIFGVDEKTKELIYPLFTKRNEKDPEHIAIDFKLINILFDTGLVNLGNAKNIETLKNINKLINWFLPKGITLSDNLLNKTLKGFANKENFANTVLAIISTIPEFHALFKTPLFNSTIKTILQNVLFPLYEKLSGILEQGLLNISSASIKGLINWDGLIDASNIVKLIDFAKSRNEISVDAKKLLDKIKIVDGKLDIVNTVADFVFANEIAPKGWTTANKILNIWSSLKKLNASHSLEPLISIIPVLLQKGLVHLSKEQIRQLANIVDFVNGYKVDVSKESFNVLKDAFINAFRGKFADAENTKTVDLSALNNVKNVKEIANIAKNMIAYNVKGIQKVTIVRPLVAQGNYSSSTEIPIALKEKSVQLKRFFLSDTKDQKHVNDESLQDVNNATTLKEFKEAIDQLTNKGLYSEFGADGNGELVDVDMNFPEFNEVTTSELLSYKELLKTLFQNMFSDPLAKTIVSTDSIDQATTLQEVIVAFNELAKSLYANIGTKFLPDIENIIQNNPIYTRECKQETIDKFKKDSLDALLNIFTNKARSSRIDTSTIDEAKTIAEIQAAFLALTSGVLYDTSGNILTIKPLMTAPIKDALPDQLTAALLNQTAHGIYGNLIETIYQHLPELTNFIFNGISNFKNDKVRLKEFIPKILIPLMKAIMPLFLKNPSFSIDSMKPIIEDTLNPVITKIAKMD